MLANGAPPVHEARGASAFFASPLPTPNMKTISLLLSAAFLCGPSILSAADWPQWRGPSRSGAVADCPKLLDRIPEGGLKELWESDEIPTNEEGGFGSPVAADGRVYMALVWHRDEPSSSRQISELVVRQLGHQSTNALGAQLVAKMEQVRESIPPTLRGAKLEEFAKQWIDENLDAKQKQLYSGFVTSRFKKGRFALPLDVLDALQKNAETVFADEAAMLRWLEEKGWPQAVRDEIVAAVPPTKRVAEDVVMCMELATGKTLWKTSLPGAPRGRSASSTPCVAEGRVVALGSTRLWSVDAVSGAVLWETPIAHRRGLGTSPLSLEGVVVVNADALTGYDARDGHEIWKQEKAGGGSSSPITWKTGGRTLVICNGRSALDAVDLHTGELVWSASGGGDSTPAVEGDILAAQARKGELGLVVYKLEASGATQLWNYPMDAFRTQSSPVVDKGTVYLMDDNVHYAFEVKSGSQRWRETAQSTIASPVLADGKLLVMANNGNTLLVLKASGEGREELGRATVRAQWVPSPCLVGDRLVLRMKDKLKCWSLAP